jgi:hypothetical protein
MEKFLFRVISNNPDYDYLDNVIEMVESVEGDVSYDKMEQVVDDLLSIGKIPSGVQEVYGEITIQDSEISVEILEKVD